MKKLFDHYISAEYFILYVYKAHTLNNSKTTKPTIHQKQEEKMKRCCFKEQIDKGFIKKNYEGNYYLRRAIQMIMPLNLSQ